MIMMVMSNNNNNNNNNNLDSLNDGVFQSVSKKLCPLIER